VEGGIMTKESDSERRLNHRMNLFFDISVSDQKGKTINVSASGVYFEIITDDVDAFAPGSVVPLRISAVDSNERTLDLSGNGRIIREDIKEASVDGSRLCVAAQFTEKLNVKLDPS
jgi:hypothetical protein